MTKKERLGVERLEREGQREEHTIETALNMKTIPKAQNKVLQRQL